jgi:anaerobic selenocysteine-containing dehydrogenase
MSQLDRRSFLKLSSATLIGVTMGGVSLNAVAQEAVKADDPVAVAMKYVAKSATEGQMCGNCMHYAKDAKGETGGCAIFAGKLVAKAGWCAGWAKAA